jgi:hypothetical protein
VDFIGGTERLFISAVTGVTASPGFPRRCSSAALQGSCAQEVLLSSYLQCDFPEQLWCPFNPSSSLCDFRALFAPRCRSPPRWNVSSHSASKEQVRCQAQLSSKATHSILVSVCRGTVRTPVNLGKGPSVFIACLMKADLQMGIDNRRPGPGTVNACSQQQHAGHQAESYGGV